MVYCISLQEKGRRESRSRREWVKEEEREDFRDKRATQRKEKGLSTEMSLNIDLTFAHFAFLSQVTLSVTSISIYSFLRVQLLA